MNKDEIKLAACGYTVTLRKDLAMRLFGFVSHGIELEMGPTFEVPCEPFCIEKLAAMSLRPSVAERVAAAASISCDVSQMHAMLRVARFLQAPLLEGPLEGELSRRLYALQLRLDLAAAVVEMLGDESAEVREAAACALRTLPADALAAHCGSTVDFLRQRGVVDEGVLVVALEVLGGVPAATREEHAAPLIDALLEDDGQCDLGPAVCAATELWMEQEHPWALKCQ